MRLMLAAAFAAAFAVSASAQAPTWPKYNGQPVTMPAKTTDTYAVVLNAARPVNDACSEATKTCATFTWPAGRVLYVFPTDRPLTLGRQLYADEGIEKVPAGTVVGDVVK